MPRIRSVHPGIFTDDAFVEISDKARVFYIGLLTECDDRGVFEWKPIKLKMRLRPWDGERVEPMLEELRKVNMVMAFSVDGASLGAVRNFCKWQRPKTPQFVYPITDDVASYVRFVEAGDDQAQRGTALARMICDQQGGKCFYCDAEITFYRKKLISLELDHKIPVSRGGGDTVENLCAACKPCNSLKGDMTDVEFVAAHSRSELRANSERRRSESGNSHTATSPRKPTSGETDIQREDGGKEVSPVATAPGERVPRQPPQRGTRLDPDWEPTEADRSWALIECQGLDAVRETQKFRDYWTAKTGQGATKLDWSATWRNWLRRAYDDGQQRGKNRGNGGGGGSPMLAGVAAAMRFVDRPRPDRPVDRPADD